MESVSRVNFCSLARGGPSHARHVLLRPVRPSRGSWCEFHRASDSRRTDLGGGSSRIHGAFVFCDCAARCSDVGSTAQLERFESCVAVGLGINPRSQRTRTRGEHGSSSFLESIAILVTVISSCIDILQPQQFSLICGASSFHPRCGCRSFGWRSGLLCLLLAHIPLSQHSKLQMTPSWL